MSLFLATVSSNIVLLVSEPAAVGDGRVQASVLLLLAAQVQPPPAADGRIARCGGAVPYAAAAVPSTTATSPAVLEPLTDFICSLEKECL